MNNDTLTLPEGTRAFRLTGENLRTWSQSDPAQQKAALHGLSPGDIVFITPQYGAQENKAYAAVLEDGTWKTTGTMQGIYKAARQSERR